MRFFYFSSKFSDNSELYFSDNFHNPLLVAVDYLSPLYFFVCILNLLYSKSNTSPYFLLAYSIASINAVWSLFLIKPNLLSSLIVLFFEMMLLLLNL